MDVNMEERLGKKIRKNRSVIPFEGMTREQKRSIEDYLCHIDPDVDAEGSRKEEEQNMILLQEYKFDNSPFEGKKLRAALRFKEIDRITVKQDADGNSYIEYIWKDGELFMWTGSKILIDQMQQDIKPDDLPAPTAIHEYENKYKKKFYKFT
jgi:hypothetical protein